MKASLESLVPLRFGAAALTVFLMASCGGGAGGASSGGSSSGGATLPGGGTNPLLQIGTTTYLDAAAIGAVAFERASAISASLNRTFEWMQNAAGASRSVPCTTAGSTGFVFTSVSANTASFANCEDSGLLLSSGAVQTTALTVLQIQPRVRLLGANFELQNVIYRAIPGDGINQTVNGALRADRNLANNVELVGSIKVLRKTGTDVYSNTRLVTPGFGSTVIVDRATMDISTPRFATSPLTLDSATINGLQVLTMTAPDQSSVKVSTLANATPTHPAQLRFDVYTAGNASPVITQILATDDGSYTAALARALQ